MSAGLFGFGAPKVGTRWADPSTLSARARGGFALQLVRLATTFAFPPCVDSCVDFASAGVPRPIAATSAIAANFDLLRCIEFSFRATRRGTPCSLVGVI